MRFTFAELFKKYRLKAEFANLTEFAEVFASKGFFYDLSIFSHWQKGSRTPTKREVLIAVIEVFIERGAINTLAQANDLLESAEHGYLTYREQKKLFKDTYLIQSERNYSS